MNKTQWPLLGVFFSLFFTLACDNQTDTIDETNSATNTPISSLKKGKDLFKKNGCIACHQEHVVSVGPSLAQINKVYANDSSLLSNYLKGNGEALVSPELAVQMQPQLALTKNLASDDLANLVEYILSVK